MNVKWLHCCEVVSRQSDSTHTQSGVQLLKPRSNQSYTVLHCPCVCVCVCVCVLVCLCVCVCVCVCVCMCFHCLVSAKQQLLRRASNCFRSGSVSESGHFYISYQKMDRISKIYDLLKDIFIVFGGIFFLLNILNGMKSEVMPNSISGYLGSTAECACNLRT